jgi:hypothetical protein
MASAAQISANQANSQLSSGPRTIDGKARSARNATSHGLTASDVVVFPGEEQAFAELRDNLRQDLRPHGEHQLQVFDQLVYHAWNRRRARTLLADFALHLGFDPAASPLVDPRVTLEVTREYERLNRHLRHHNAGYNRSIRELRIAQTDFSTRLLISPTAPRALPPLADLAQVTKQTQFGIAPIDILRGLESLCVRNGLPQTPDTASTASQTVK